MRPHAAVHCAGVIHRCGRQRLALPPAQHWGWAAPGGGRLHNNATNTAWQQFQASEAHERQLCVWF